ncbi:MAG: hypothetical protein C6P37_06040 [Caldibacillus debilis]|uniref:Uncharacterized protein n=1 Tax=Caldibacillus debilis TaxID=301148 RepID=A0A3E0K6Q8_9BACI|nr:MAG: hypothetical protein C6W57_11815 [Caldibacillus debilis]REJ22542.1 MAG: hypothetical protein C6W56_16165 [Caldibacillus debilis]REJ29498.1 MAG: hypothetical protein C6P37_06040 [Caldibacillus debilis]
MAAPIRCHLSAGRCLKAANGTGEAGGACHLPAEAGTSGSGLPQPAGEKVAPVPPQGLARHAPASGAG